MAHRRGISLPQPPGPSLTTMTDFTPSFGRPAQWPQGAPPHLSTPQTLVTRPQPLTLGFNTKIAPPDLPVGASPTMQNFLMRDGGIEPRFNLASLSTAPGLSDVAIGMTEYSTTTGVRYPVVMSAATFSWYNPSTAVWSTSSYVANSINTKPSGPNTDYWDFAITYHPTLDENILVFTNGNNAAFSWDGASATSKALFSTLTNAPIAKYVAPFDSRLLFGYIVSGSLTLPQRIEWTGRGLPETANQVASDGGFYDILDASGRIQRLVEDGPRVLVFFDYEIWQGFKADYPFDLQFVRLAPTLGLAAPFSVAKTPNGVVFLGSDYKVYLIAPGGTPQSISDDIWASMRDEIANPERSVGIYDPRLGEYQLYYPVAGGTGRPTHSRHFNLNDQTWTPHTFAHDICVLTEATLSSIATTFGGLIGTFAQQTLTYGQLGGVSGQRTVLAGTSSGTVAQFLSTATTDMGTRVNAQYLGHIGNPSPDRRLLLNELWIDYRADSASSLTIKVSKDFGQSFDNVYSVGLPAANPSGQTVVQVLESAVYPSVQIEADAGTRFRLQRILARAEDTGRG